jgi:adenosine deaminase
VFGTTLSREYAMAATAFGLSQEQLTELSGRAVAHAFCSEQEKAQLQSRLAAFKQDQPGEQRA